MLLYSALVPTGLVHLQRLLPELPPLVGPLYLALLLSLPQSLSPVFVVVVVVIRVIGVNISNMFIRYAWRTFADLRKYIGLVEQKKNGFQKRAVDDIYGSVFM